jgi:hypothetical protein
LEIKLRKFLALAQDECEWLASFCRKLTSEAETRSQLDRRLGDPTAGLDFAVKRKILPCRKSNRGLLLLAYRFTSLIIKTVTGRCRRFKMVLKTGTVGIKTLFLRVVDKC